MSQGLRARQPVKESREAIDRINQSTFEKLKAENNLNIGDKNVAYTVAVSFFEEVARYIKDESEATGKPVVVQLDGLCTIGTSTVESETGEKAGNLVPYISLGEFFKLGVKNDTSTEE